MIRLAISVEGRTEEEFIRDLLIEHLRVKGIEAMPVSLCGNITINRLAKEMVDLFWDNFYVTSLVDYYGFKDKGDKTLCQLEQAISDAVNGMIHVSWDERVIFPYVQSHEFEGLLFSDIASFVTILGADEACIDKLRSIRRAFRTPEDIDDSPVTAPSKRIKQLIPAYDKPIDGSLLAMETGLERIRTECPRFNQWVTRLEELPSLAEG